MQVRLNAVYQQGKAVDWNQSTIDREQEAAREALGDLLDVAALEFWSDVPQRQNRVSSQVSAMIDAEYSTRLTVSAIY